MGVRRKSWGWGLAWLLPGLLSMLTAFPVGLIALLIGTDEARAARPYMATAMILLFGGAVMLIAGAVRVFYLFLRSRDDPDDVS